MSQAGKIIQAGGAAGPILSLTGNNGVAVVPVAGNINIVAPAAYGTIFGQGRVVGTNLAPTATLTINPYIQPTLQTTDATPNELLWNLPMLASSTVTFFAVINGTQSDYSNAITGTVVGSAIRGAIGAPSLVGDPIINTNNTLAFDAEVNVIISANNMQLVVTGIAATTINWTALVYFVNN